MITARGCITATERERERQTERRMSLSGVFALPDECEATSAETPKENELFRKNRSLFFHP